MKMLPIMIISAGLLAFAHAREPVDLGDWGRITLPDTYKLNEPFKVKVEVLKLEAPSRLVLTANWKNRNDGFGGFLQYFSEKAITEPGVHEMNLTIRKDKPDLKTAVLTVYLSPDGEWKNNSANGTADILKTAAVQSNMDTLAEKSEQTQKAAPFSSETSPKLPSLKEAGLAETPGFEDTFDPGWPMRDKAWEVATWKQNGTQMSPERAAVNEDGQLVLTVKAGSPFQGGSLQSNREFGFGRWVARVKAAAEPGVLNSIFTKDWDNLKTETPNDGNKGEVDIEILSHTFGPGTGEVHLAIHLKGHTPLWHLDIPLDFNPSDDYHEWGFDILPDRVVWHVDGRVLHTWKYTDEHFITPDYEFFFNAWTMEKWIKGPPAKDAQYHIDWVRFYPLVEE